MAERWEAVESPSLVNVTAWDALTNDVTIFDCFAYFKMKYLFKVHSEASHSQEIPSRMQFCGTTVSTLTAQLFEHPLHLYTIQFPFVLVYILIITVLFLKVNKKKTGF